MPNLARFATITGVLSGEKRFAKVLVLAMVLHAAVLALGQSAIPVGQGSYAGSVPAEHLGDDGYYGPTPGAIIREFDSLYISPALKGRALPTNTWWTDLLIGQRSRPATNGGNEWFSRQMDEAGTAGMLHTMPGVVQPTRTGMNLFYPKRWQPNDSTPPAYAKANLDLGPALRIENYTGLQLGTEDQMLADFGQTTYPAGWTATGDLVGTAPIPGGSWPGQSPAVTGLLGAACFNSYRGTDVTEGTLTSPEFTVTRRFIAVKSGGGSDSVNTCVQLIVDGVVVNTAVGQQDATLRWTRWDVTALAGKKARLVVRDTSKGGWGFTLCAAIIATDSTMDPEARFTTTLNVPHVTITGYGDWSLDYRHSGDASGATADTTLVRGSPFVWCRYSGVSPRILTGGAPKLYDLTGNAIAITDNGFKSAAFAFDVIDGQGAAHTFGVYAPDNTKFTVRGAFVEASRPAYLVYALLPARSSLSEFKSYAFARPTNTTYSWSYTPSTGLVSATWQIATSPLKGTGTSTLQGWLPHHYRTTTRSFSLLASEYLTSRGKLILAAGSQFTLRYPFRGIAPVLPKPIAKGISNDYSEARMQGYLKKFAAAHPTNGADTYWQGKEFGLSGQYLSLASQSGDASTVRKLQSELRSSLADWMTYTPGESKNFFATYPGWKGLIGFNTGFGSAAFNDQHFHYGYFAVGAALVGMHDSAFLTQYGPMLRLVAKQYANWERTDPQFPFLRCFDVWEGHSWAGGVSGPGGNNQESSSEAMNSWVGLFLLGSLTGDTAMRDAGAMGYCVEGAATNEYWQDAYGSNFPTTYGRGSTGILFADSVAYATYFSGDPAWIYGIQWTPANHWNNYLAKDLAVARRQYTQLWDERVSLSEYNRQFNPGGFRLNDANTPAALGAYPGAYVLGFESLFDPAGAVAKLEGYWNANEPIATDGTYAGAVYYVAHALRGLGLQDFSSYTSIPTSQAFRTDSGVRTFVIYNPAIKAQTANLYVAGAKVGSVVVPARTTITTTALSGGSAKPTPYFGVPAAIPGTVDLVNFDYGGEGVGYHDLDGTNQGGAYRTDEAPDIAAVSIADNVYRISGTAAGQWKSYTVNVAREGTYQVTLMAVATEAGKTIRIVSGSGALLSKVNVPIGRTPTTFLPVMFTVKLAAGVQTLRLVEDSPGMSLLRLQFVAVGSAAEIPTGRAIALRSVQNQRFVAAEDAGRQPLIANRGAAAGWETFGVMRVRTGVVALRAAANGKIVTLNPGNRLIANKNSVTSDQEFEWVDLGDRMFALRSVRSGSYVSVPAAEAPLEVVGNSAGSAEAFRYELLD